MTRPFLVSASVADPDFAVPAKAAAVIAAADAAGLDLLVMGRAGARPFDAQVLAAWAAPLTQGVGLVATVPASNAHPFHVARALSAVDFLCGGLTGWSVIAEDAQPGVAEDMVRAARALWDGWGSNCLIIDKASGHYLHSEMVHQPNYEGPFFKVAGPVNAMRPPQGQPVLVVDSAAAIAIDDADVALVDAPGATAGAAKRLLKVAGDVDVAALAQAFAAGEIDGVHFTLDDSADDLPAAIARIGALFTTRPGAPRATTGTLRERLGLPLSATASTQSDGARVPEYVA